MSGFMAKDMAAYIRGEHQIEPGLQLWSAGVILRLREESRRKSSPGVFA